MSGNRVKGKILLVGQIECVSPVHVGSGRDDRSDMDILLDSDGNPFIPATSFVGILRHAIEERSNMQSEFPQNCKEFWGYTEDQDGRQSALCCSDLTWLSGEPLKIVVRDGIRIDNKKGLVEQGGKFDFELVERGNRFRFNVELTYREKDEAFVKKTARTIYDLLAEQRIQIGAKTNSGFGQIRLLKDETQIFEFDFSKKIDVFNWLMQNFSQENVVSFDALGKAFDLREEVFSLRVILALRNSLIIRSYSHEPKMPDTTQLRSRDDWVIPGSSLKGAIRARAERIVNTLELENAGEIITGLFGNVDDVDDDKRKSKNAKKGKVRIQETILTERDFPAELQARIKVDRFTGGVIEGALFDSMPVFAPSGGSLITVQIDVTNYEKREAGLLLLVLKDLWSGDLAVGGEKNVGRGVFEGVRAEVVWNGEKIALEKDLGMLSADEREKLQHFVDALVSESEPNE